MTEAAEPGTPSSQGWRRFIPGLVGVLILGGIGIGVVYLVKNMLGGGPPPKKLVQQVTLIVPPAPPPPVEKPPEPVVKEEVEVPEPPQAVNEPAPGSNLGVDADGGSGDSFGLVGKKGGRGLLEGNPFAWYDAVVKQDITDRLMDDKRIRRARYSVVLRLWVARDGRIERYELANSSGDQALDESLKAALAHVERLAEAPPLEMPQPMKIRLMSRL